MNATGYAFALILFAAALVAAVAMKKGSKKEPFNIPDRKEMKRLYALIKAGRGSNAIADRLCRGSVYHYLRGQGVSPTDAAAYALSRAHRFTFKEKTRG